MADVVALPLNTRNRVQLAAETARLLQVAESACTLEDTMDGLLRRNAHRQAFSPNRIIPFLQALLDELGDTGAA